MVTSPLFLNVGSGSHPLPGFVNIDLNPEADLRHDLSKGLPYPDRAVDRVFSEHFLEHLSQAQGLAFLRECRRVLKPGGVMRIAMPDLDELVRRYSSTDWRGDGDMFKMGWHWVDNRCEMMNIGMREWGHQWVYNDEELRLAAQRAGLSIRGRLPWGESDLAEFRGLEYRPGSRLVMEFEKPRRDTAQNPLVSVLVPAYQSRFFEPALRSALEQTYRNLELLIFDDSAGPEIERIVTRLARDDSRVVYERNPERLGGLDNYLKCFERARGPFIKFLNDDDVLAPTCIERMIAVLLSEPDVTVVTSHRQCIDEQGRPLPALPATRRIVDSDSVIEGASLAMCALEYGNYVGEPTTILFRKEDAAWIRPNIMSFGGETIRGSGDGALWMNLLGRGDAAYLAETLSYLRLHPDQRQREPEIKAVAAKYWKQMRFHAKRLGFGEHARAPTIRIRPLGEIEWRSERFRWAPRGGVVKARALKKRAAQLIPKATRERLKRAGKLLTRAVFDSRKFP